MLDVDLIAAFAACHASNAHFVMTISPYTPKCIARKRRTLVYAQEISGLVHFAQIQVLRSLEFFDLLDIHN